MKKGDQGTATTLKDKKQGANEEWASGIHLWVDGSITSVYDFEFEANTIFCTDILPQPSSQISVVMKLRSYTQAEYADVKLVTALSCLPFLQEEKSNRLCPEN